MADTSDSRPDTERSEASTPSFHSKKGKEMTRDEMREKVTGLDLATERTVWDASAEICERLEAILKRLDEPLNVCTKPAPDHTHSP